MRLLEGKTATVTGAGRGLGLRPQCALDAEADVRGSGGAFAPSPWIAEEDPEAVLVDELIEGDRVDATPFVLARRVDGDEACPVIVQL